MHRWRKLELLILGLFLVGCQSPEPQIIIHTRVVEATAPCPTRETTRLVREIVTATPAPPTPTPSPPVVRLALPPLKNNGLRERAQLAGQLGAWLTAHGGLAVRVILPADERQSVASLCAGEAEIAWLSVPAYLLARETCGVEAVLRPMREESAQRTQIVVQSDEWRRARGLGPLRSLRDLDGLTLGFTDPHAIGGYIIPRAMLAQAGVAPGAQVFLGGDAQAFLAVYRGEVDAAACLWRPPRNDTSPADARVALLETYPDALRALETIRLSDAVPNEPLVVRSDLSPAVRADLMAALVELGRSEEGGRLLRELGDVIGWVTTRDGDYDVVREALRLLQLGAEQVLD